MIAKKHMNTKQEYEDDPEGYWKEKRDRKESNGRERLERWEKENPNVPYGWSMPSWMKEDK